MTEVTKAKVGTRFPNKVLEVIRTGKWSENVEEVPADLALQA